MENPKIKVDKNGVQKKELTDIAQDISDYCTENYKLKYPDINFHLVDLETLSGICAAHGWPVYPETWQMAQEYLYNYWGHEWGNFRVYEIVCPAGGSFDKDGKTNEPLDAFIYDIDTMVDTKLVIAHVYGHAHALTNNRVGLKGREYAGLSSPYTSMVEFMEKVEDMYDKQGLMPVADLLDAVNVITSLVAYNPDFLIRCDELFREYGFGEQLERKWPMWEEQRNSVEDKIERALEERKQKKIVPPWRINDIFLVLENNPALSEWERDIIQRARKMNEYNLNTVAPVKILHEGFASFIDMRFGMENTKHISEGELRKYIQHRTDGFKHSPRSINPYGFGFTLLYSIMAKWATGSYGFDYDLLKKSVERQNWSKGMDLERGWDKVLEVVGNSSDYDMIQNYFDQEYFMQFARNFYVHEVERWETYFWGTWYIDIIKSKQFEKVKNALLFNACNGARPFFHINPDGANYKGRGELMIIHDVNPLPQLFDLPREALTLDVDSVESILKAVHYMWKKPVHLKTIDEYGEALYISYNGKVFRESPSEPS